MAMNWSKFLVPARGVQLFFALIIMAIDASLIALWRGSYSEFNFVIFASLFTLIVTTYLLITALRFPDNGTLTHPYLVFGLEAVSWLFWLAAWAAFAAIVNTGLCNGAADRYWGNERGCGSIKAVLAFAILEWFLFCFTAAIAGIAAYSALRGGRSSGRGGFGASKNASSGGMDASSDGGVVHQGP